MNMTNNEKKKHIKEAELKDFKAKIKEDGILTNVTSTQGEKQDDFVRIVIEGDLP